MKVLLIQNRFFPAIGGGELHTYLLAKYLTKYGHDVTVYTTNSLTKEDLLSVTLKPPFIIRPKNKTPLPAEEVIEKITVKRYDSKLRFWGFNWVPGLSKELSRSIDTFDVVHVHGYHISTSLTGCHYAKMHKKPLILTAHDVIISDNFTTEAKVLKKLYDLTFGRYLLKRSTRLIALTEDHIQQFTDRGGNRDNIRIVPNGIELSRYKGINVSKDLMARYGIMDDDRVLLFVGRLEKYKGVQDLLEILPGIIEQFPRAKLLVVGKNYGYESALKDMAKEKSLGGSVIFTGGVPDDELLQFYTRADMFLFPSQMEGFGIVLLEAMATNTLCIAYPIPAVRRLITSGNNGVLVKSKEEFSDQIRYYLSHPDAKAAIERNAGQFVEEYDIGSIIRRVENVYKEAIDANQPRR